jgi:hypothetical protein
MKFVKYLTAFAIVTFMLSFSAFAKDNNSAKFTLSETVQVGTTQLAPGDYKAEWNGSPDDLKIEILKDGKTVATTQGKIQDLHERAPYDAVITKTAQNNTKELEEIEFNHQAEALMFAGE